jgi:hypothetical protein
VADDAVSFPKLGLPIVNAGLAALGKKNAGVFEKIECLCAEL